jgi:L-cysteine/cystine lyase
MNRNDSLTDSSPAVTEKDNQHRRLFKGLENKAYFNFGGQGILPQPALRAIVSAYEYLQENGPFSLKVNTWLQQQLKQTREIIALELGTTPETITFTENVTAGCDIALWGIDWQKGDRILMTDCEHQGIIATVGQICQRFGVEVDICPIMATLNGGNALEVIAAHLKPHTRLVVLSHLLWNTGQVLPLKEIVAVCHNYTATREQIRILVDAAQSVGSLALNLNELEADYYAFTGHKWLCGAGGVGGLYVRPEVFAKTIPSFSGWRAVDVNSQGEISGWKEDGQKFELATSAYPQYLGLTAAIRSHCLWGTSEERYRRICQLSAYLWQEINKIDRVRCLKYSPPEAGLVSFRVDIKVDHSEIVKLLEREGIYLRTIASPDCIRACVHYFTLPSEIDRLVDSIDRLVKTN